MRKLVDPIHLFDSSGLSVMTGDYLRKENDRLTKENAELKARAMRLFKRLQAIETDKHSSH